MLGSGATRSGQMDTPNGAYPDVGISATPSARPWSGLATIWSWSQSSWDTAVWRPRVVTPGRAGPIGSAPSAACQAPVPGSRGGPGAGRPGPTRSRSPSRGRRRRRCTCRSPSRSGACRPRSGGRSRSGSQPRDWPSRRPGNTRSFVSSATKSPTRRPRRRRGDRWRRRWSKPEPSAGPGRPGDASGWGVHSHYRAAPCREAVHPAPDRGVECLLGAALPQVR
jgi:hypothetical protein